MKNHGNAPTSAQYAEFSGIVQSKLWPAIKNRISQEEMQALVTGSGPEEVLKRLREAFAAAKSESKVAPHQCPFFADDEKPSNDGYPPEYAVKPIVEQLLIWSKLFPDLDPSTMFAYSKRLQRRPKGAEGPFVIPKWEKVGFPYEVATKKVINLLPSGRVEDNIGKFLRHERTVAAEEMITKEHGGDYMLLWAQFGLLHRGRSNRRVNAVYTPREFCLGVFSVCAMLLTHPERLTGGHFGVSCPGDRWSLGFENFKHVLTFYFHDGVLDHYAGWWPFNNDGSAYGPATAFLPANVSA